MRIPTTIILLTVLSVIVLGFKVRPVQAALISFTFAAGGDIGSLEPGDDGGKSLARLRTSNPNPSFFLALGDLEYSAYDSNTNPEQTWCNKFKDSASGFNNVLIIAGNHDTGETNDQAEGGKSDLPRLIQYCPYPLGGSPIGDYGREYYFDYPSGTPLARFIMVSPRIANITGLCLGTSCATDSQSCSNLESQQVGRCYWQYSAGDSHYNWVKNAIDGARTSGIRWVIVGMHKVCISSGDKSCAVRPDLFDLLVSRRVDLILQAHDHTYQEAKQLALNSSTCSGFSLIANNYVQYNADCIVDGRTDGAYIANIGATTIIQGTMGQNPLGGLNPSGNTGQSGYFAAASASNHGFVKYTVSQSQVSILTDMDPSTFSDSLTVYKSFSYIPDDLQIAHPVDGEPVTFTARTTGGPESFSAYSWNFGDGGTATGSMPTHSFSAPSVPVVYNVTLTYTGSSEGKEYVTFQPVKVYPIGGGSVAYGTLITTPERRIPVQNLEAGSTIVVYDVFSGVSTTSTIVSIRHLMLNNMLTIQTTDPLPLRVDANPRLRFYTLVSGIPVLRAVTELSPGDLLYSYDARTWVPIVSIHTSSGGQHEFFDLITDPYLTPDQNYLSFIANGYADPCTPACKEGPGP